MTKSNLITAVNAQLTAIITQAKVRLASLEIINVLYPTTKMGGTLATGFTNIVDEETTDLNFAMYMKKQGNVLNVSGYVLNNTGAITGLSSLGTITDSEYEVITGGFLVCNNGVLISFDGANITIGSLGVGEQVNFNGILFLND